MDRESQTLRDEDRRLMAVVAASLAISTAIAIAVLWCGT